MKQMLKRSILLLFVVFILILGVGTRVNADDTITYSDLTASRSNRVLVLDEHESETLEAKAYNDGEEVTNPIFEWKSNDESIATVDTNGVVKAIKAGETTVVVSGGGKSAEFKITVINSPTFTDFSKAKYTLTNENSSSRLKVSNVEIDKDSTYYYAITSTNVKPELVKDSSGSIETEKCDFDFLAMLGKIDEVDLSKYVELNQDLYLWVVQTARLEKSYDANDKSVSYKSEFVVSGEKLTRPQYPTYAEMFRYTFLSYSTDQIVFNIPIDGKTQRKFTLKIGKITDNTILNGIKNNKGESWNDLLKYAKESKAIYNNKLSTSQSSSEIYSAAYYSEKSGVIKLSGLEDKAYYYMYIVMDDENGKYYPAAGLTIAKADVFKEQGTWYLNFLDDDKFKWDEFNTTQTGNYTVDKNKTGETTNKNTPSSLPKTGTEIAGLVAIFVTAVGIVYFKIKNDKYRGL